MRLYSLIAMAALTTNLAHAETVTCSFTEPFITVTYDPTQKSVSVHDAIENQVNVYPVKSVATDSNGMTDVTWNSASGDLRSLKYQMESRGGSDGMSNYVFPMTGKLSTENSTYDLIGGCDTPSEPAVDPETSPIPGCYEMLQTEYEDGASYYTAIGEKIVNPLQAKPENKVLGDFLSSALVVRGYMSVDFQLCRTIDDAVKK
jgi:hypothetical protein